MHLFFFLAAIGLQNSDFMLALTKEQQQQPISGFGHENLLTRHLMRRNAQEPCHSQLIYAPDFVCTEWQSDPSFHTFGRSVNPAKCHGRQITRRPDALLGPI